MKEISINQNSSTEKVKFGPVGRDIILNEKIEDETARAIAKETQLEAAIATAGAVKDVKYNGTSIVVDKVAEIKPSIEASVAVETARAEAAEGTLQTNITNEVTRAQGAETTLTTNLATEVTNRTNADTTLQANINNEAAARANADNELISQISNKADISELMNEGYTRETADSALNDRIDSLESRGRFLSTWNATTGKPNTYPTVPEGAEYPYTYLFKPGDYYIINNVPETGTKYKPTGSSIIKETAESEWTIGRAEETESVSNNGSYTFDSTNWVLMGAGAAAAWGSIGGNIADQEDLSTALNSKVDLTSEQTISGQKSFNGTTYLGGTVYVPTSNFTTRDIKPSDTNTYSLGTPDKRFANLYLSSYLNVSGFVDSDLKPRNNDHYNLGRDDGSNVNRWKNIYVSQKLDFKAKTDTPATTASWQLDSRSNGNFVVSCNNGDAYIFRQNDFIPYGSNVNRNLGVAGNYWNDLYLKGKIDLYNSTSAQTWGLTGSQYDGIFITRSSANIYTFNTDGIFPSSNSARSLGTSDYKWKNIYFQGELNANGSAGTSGQVLTSNGSGAAPTWQDAPTPTNMVTTDTAQTITGLKTIQAQSNGQAMIFTDGTYSYPISYSGNSTCGIWTVNGQIYPSTNKSYSLGSSSSRWGTVYCNGVSTTGSVTPAADGTLYLGSSSWQWKNISTRGMEIYGGNTSPYTTSPALTFVYKKSGSTHSNSITCVVGSDNKANFTIQGHMWASLDNTYQFGASDRRWSTVYTTNISDGTNSTTVANIAVKSTESTETTGQLKIAVVTALPENPDANTLYFIKEA